MSAVCMKIIAAILSFLAFIPRGEVDPYKASDPAEDNLTFAVVADMHLESFTKKRFDILGETFRDLDAAENKNDVLVFAGDNTMNGMNFEQFQLYGIMNRFNTVPVVLMACGNHDIGPNDNNFHVPFQKLRDRFIRFNNAFLDDKLPAETTYRSKIVNGYHFIILGTDADDGIRQHISENQFSWLEEELIKAQEDGKPVFLFSHWPVNHVFADVWPDGHVGDQSERLTALLKKYDNRIFFFNGHLHMGLYDNNYHVVDDGQITYLNVPGLGVDNNDGEADHQESGMGLQVSVYDDYVNVHVRNFAEHEWTDFNYNFNIDY